MVSVLNSASIHYGTMQRLGLSLRWLPPAIILLALVACGGRDGAQDQSVETPTLTVVNETPCIVHVRFDNGPPKFRVTPGATHQFTDQALADYRYIKVESTQAIFHTYDMERVRADGYRLVVRPAYEDDPCVEH